MTRLGSTSRCPHCGLLNSSLVEYSCRCANEADSTAVRMYAGSAVAGREVAESAAVSSLAEASCKDDAIDSLWEDDVDAETASSQTTSQPQRSRRMLSRTLTSPNNQFFQRAVSPAKSLQVAEGCDTPNDDTSLWLRKTLTVNNRTLSGGNSAQRPPTASPARSSFAQNCQIGSSSVSKLERKGFAPSSLNPLAGRRVLSFSDVRVPTSYFQ